MLNKAVKMVYMYDLLRQPDAQMLVASQYISQYLGYSSNYYFIIKCYEKCYINV